MKQTHTQTQSTRLREFLSQQQSPKLGVNQVPGITDEDLISTSHHYETQGIKKTLMFIQSLNNSQLKQFHTLIKQGFNNELIR
jgi:hypothetical protein